MATTIYRSTDSSAPTLSGTAGDLIALLDACLVTGYGAKAAAGWSKPYTGTNTAVFRYGSGLQHYLDVDDNAPGAGTGKEARVRGYETMTAVATGTNPFPTTAQATNGIFVRKSTTADATTRPWLLAADERTFYLFVQTGDSAGTYYSMGFGEFYSFVTSDPGRSVIIARGTENSAVATVEGLERLSTGLGTSALNASGSKFLARAYTGAVGSVSSWSIIADSGLITAVIGAGSMDYTNPADNRSYSSPVRVTETSGAATGNVRGRLRGLRAWHHAITAASDGDTIPGAVDLAGREFLVVKQSPGAGLWLIETTDWEMN